MLTKEQIDQIAKENEQITTVPTLNQLLDRLRLAEPAVRYYYRMVAIGQAQPILMRDNAILAAQTLTVLFKHIEDNPVTNFRCPRCGGLHPVCPPLTCEPKDASTEKTDTADSTQTRDASTEETADRKESQEGT